MLEEEVQGGTGRLMLWLRWLTQLPKGMEQASGDRSLELRSMVDDGDVYSIEAESKAMK